MPDDIKWPQKVTRYRIQCPFQRLLIAKHEKQIDWSGHRIENGEALDRYLREVMLPSLKDCITPDHPKSHYCNGIHLERMLANPAPHINEARKIQQREGDEAARQFLLGHINGHKKEHFEGWWHYLMEENPLYRQHPAFQYLMLRPVLEGSTAKDTRTSLPVDAEALAHLFDRMQAGRVAPGTKLLPLISEIMAFGAKMAGDGQRPSFGTDCRWMVVNQQDANAANRLAALSQGSGWCVASSDMADYYLGDSEFHLLVEGGRAKVALRLSKNQAVEVQGHNNQDPELWWPRILLYCAARGTQITHRHDTARSQAQIIRQELVAAQKTTRRLGELLKAQPAKVHLVTMPDELDDASRLVVQKAWLACVRADPLCGGLLPSWMEADPAVKQATLEAWVTLVGTDPQSYGSVPSALAQEPRIVAALRTGWRELLKHDVAQWNQCPEILQKDEEVIQARKTGWIELLNRDVTKWNTCPEFLQMEFRQVSGFIQTLKTAWMELLKRDVTIWNTCPEFLQQDVEVIHARKTGWIELLNRNVTRWNSCPNLLQHEFRQDVGFIQAFETRWVELLKRDVTIWNTCPEFLQQDEEVIHARKTGWMELLKRDVTRWNTCPDFLQQDAEVIQARKMGWMELLKRDVSKWNTCPDFLQQDAEVIGARKTGWMELLKRNVNQWSACPEELRKDPEIRRLGMDIDRWCSVIRYTVEIYDGCPVELKAEAKIQAAWRAGWLSYLKRHPNAWTSCPLELQTHSDMFGALLECQAIQKARKSMGLETKSLRILVESLAGRRASYVDRRGSSIRFNYGWHGAVNMKWLQKAGCRIQPWQGITHLWIDEASIQILLGYNATASKVFWSKLIESNVTQWVHCPEFLQKDEELMQARKKGWMELLKRDVSQWNACPEFLWQEFREDGDFILTLRTGWMELLKYDVLKWDLCPNFLQNDRELIHASKKGWAELIRRDVDRWFQCPEFLRDHAEIKSARVEGEINWARSVSLDQRALSLQRLVDRKIVKREDLPTDLRLLIQIPPDYSEQTPPPLPSDRLPDYAAVCFNALLQQPQATLSIVQVWKHSPRMELARCAQALAALREQPWNFSALPADQQSHPLIHEAAVEGWVLFVTKHPFFQSQVPESLRSHPILQTTLASLCEEEKKALAKQVLEKVTKHPGLSDMAMSDLKLPTKEKQTWKQVTALRLKHWKKQVKEDARAWEKVPQSLQQDGTLLKLMREGLGPQIRQSPAHWSQLPSSYRDDPALQRVHRFATGT